MSTRDRTDTALREIIDLAGNPTGAPRDLLADMASIRAMAVRALDRSSHGPRRIGLYHSLQRRYPDVWDEIERCIKVTECVVIGDRFQCWKELQHWVEESDHSTFTFPGNHTRTVYSMKDVWEEMSTGYVPTIDNVFIGKNKVALALEREREPIRVNLLFACILGRVVCFYEPASIVVDWRLIRHWQDRTFPNAKVEHIQNFANAIHHIGDLNKAMTHHEEPTPDGSTCVDCPMGTFRIGLGECPDIARFDYAKDHWVGIRREDTPGVVMDIVRRVEQECKDRVVAARSAQP